MKLLRPCRLTVAILAPALAACTVLGGEEAPRHASDGAARRASESAERRAPNILVVLADDLGYGDVRALNPASRIPTPELDRLAAGGMTFTDGHSPSAVCTPTRYGLLTGRYCWRTRLKRGVLGGYSEPLLAPGRSTLATLLRARGYATGAVGKWHLGMDLPYLDPESADRAPWAGDPGIDFSGLIEDSPIDHGFDSYFGVCASLDMAPYVWVRDDRFTMEPSHRQEAVKFPHFVRAGPRADDFVIDEVLDRLVDEASGFIARHAGGEQPFFLYVPLTAPHKPAQPHARFRGKTELGEYGDFVAQVDWSVGRILAALESSGAADDTLVVFTSDNGSYMHRYDDPARRDHTGDERIQGFRADVHRANGPFRGTKADIFEAGHHVPLFVRWPGEVRPGAASDETVCLTDLYATFAEIAGAELGMDEAEDSCSLLALLRGDDAPRGAPVVHHSVSGMFAIRDGKWKLVAGNGSGGRAKPKGRAFERPYQLFDMSADAAETTDLIEQHPRVAARLEAELEEIRASGRSAPPRAASVGLQVEHEDL